MGDWRVGRDGRDPLAELDASLADAELNAVETDYTDRLRAAYALSTEVLEAAQAGAFTHLEPHERQFLCDWLDDNIAQLETLRG